MDYLFVIYFIYPFIYLFLEFKIMFILFLCHSKKKPWNFTVVTSWVWIISILFWNVALQNVHVATCMKIVLFDNYDDSVSFHLVNYHDLVSRWSLLSHWLPTLPQGTLLHEVDRLSVQDSVPQNARLWHLHSGVKRIKWQGGQVGLICGHIAVS